MRLGRMAAVLTLGGAILAGCSDGETANETLPSTTSTTAKTTGTLPPLGPPDMPMPAEARAKTVAGAQAFLHYYVSLMNDAQGRSTSEYLRGLSTDDCGTCIAFSDGIDAYVEKGYHLSGGVIELATMPNPLLRDNAAEFFLSLRQTPSAVIDPTGDPLPELAERGTSYPASGATLAWDADQSSWLMSALTIS
jgi:hypothetical protein